MSDDLLKKYTALSPEEALKTFEEDADKGLFKPKGIMASSRTYRPLSKEEMMKQFDIDKAKREYSLKKAIPFISHRFLSDFILTQGLVLVGACTGKSKSTTAANVAAGYIQYSTNGQKVKIISNEESSESVLCRIACIFEKLSFNAYYRGQLKPKDAERIQNRAMLLLDKVEVICNHENYDMTVYEDVKAVLNQAASSNDTGMVILDYLQTVSRSIEEPSQESYVISKRFGHFLRKYGEAVMVPVVVFAQIRESKELALKDRIQNDKTILDHAFQAIEIVPDFETKTTTFKIHKDRHGSHQGKECIMRYVDGRYEPETAF